MDVANHENLLPSKITQFTVCSIACKKSERYTSYVVVLVAESYPKMAIKYFKHHHQPDSNSLEFFLYLQDRHRPKTISENQTSTHAPRSGSIPQNIVNILKGLYSCSGHKVLLTKYQIW